MKKSSAPKKPAIPLIQITEEFRRKINELKFSKPVELAYNPLDYAWAPFKSYLERFARGHKKAIFLGMNPGPWGMTQTGIPFGEVRIVKEWLGINEPVSKPKNEHASRPITGFDCTRSEVSGARLWGFFKNHFEKPESFFKEFFVVNYCPLIFFDEGLRNLTPDKLKKAETQKLFALCDAYLRSVQSELKADYWIGVGAFAMHRAKSAFAETAPADAPQIFSILHPSPASPLANRGWAEAATRQLREHSILI